MNWKESETEQVDSGRRTKRHVSWFSRETLRGLTLVGLAVTGLGLLAERFWWADLICQLKLQIGFAALLIAVALACHKSWRFCLLALLGMVVNVWPALPYLTTGTRLKAIEKDRRYTLLTANVLTRNENHAAVVELVRSEKPDFVVLMEVNDRWQNGLSELHDDYPYRAFYPQQDNFGIALLSKHRWQSVERFEASSLQLPSLDVRFDDLGGEALRILATHPIPPMGPRRWRDRNQQLENVFAKVEVGEPTLVTGDFNLTPWSPIFQRLIHESDMRDAAVSFGIEPTWNLFPTWLGGLKLDHVIVSGTIRVTDYEVGRTIGSDHRPVVVTFCGL